MVKKVLFYVAAGLIFAALTIEMVIFNSIPVDAATHSRTMKITAYCGCRKCNGKWYGLPTASGTDYEEGRTIAVDKHQIPLGTHVWVNGHEYVAEDTGKHIDWDCIDIYFDDHQEAKKFGIKYMNVEW